MAQRKTGKAIALPQTNLIDLDTRHRRRAWERDKAKKLRSLEKLKARAERAGRPRTNITERRQTFR